MCLATEWVQQSHSASAASLITSSVPNLLQVEKKKMKRKLSPPPLEKLNKFTNISIKVRFIFVDINY